MNHILKHSILWLSFLICAGTTKAQIVMSNGTSSSCNNSFFDSGGPAGGYGNNENFTYTLCSDNTGGNTHVSLTFDQLGIDAGDVICFYDGDDVTAPLIICSTDIPANTAFVIQASAINPSGCVTITFMSDGATTGAGWSAGVSCVQQCQTITSIIANSTPPISPPDTGYIDICPGDLVVFNGSALYPQNNFIYTQSDNTSTFEWDFGDGTSALGPNVQHVYPTPGGYIVQLTVTDINGCINTNFISQRIRVSGPPVFNLSEDLSPVICVNDTISIFTGVNDTLADITISPGVGGFQAGGTVADSVCVPDGTGETYYSSLELLDFSPGQTLNNINDLLGICVNMEHSFLGDLEIIITCPSGQTVTLHNFSNFSGGGYWLGNPIDNNPNACASPANVGTGETYCWTPDATNGTWLESAGLVVANQLPPGDYSSFQDLNGLIGCTLNGQWTISIEDFWGVDDGVIFSWNLALNEAIFPNLETYDLSIVNAEWLADPSIITNTPDSMVASPQYPGGINYVFEATDNFGCVYDTSVAVVVLPQTDPACYNCTGNLTPIPDVTICDDGENTTLTTSLVNVQLTSTTFQGTSNSPFGNNTHPVNSPLLSTIDVAGLPYNFIDANSIQSVCINSTQFNSIDVVATLIAPNGSSVILTNGQGIGPFQSNFTGTCFSPLATNAISTGTGPFTGDWIPIGDFNNLVGSQANGTWTLAIADQYGGFDSNSLQNWNITFSLVNELTYAWTPSAGLTCDNCPSPVAQPTSTTNYNVTATDAYGCTFTESVTVTVIDCSIPCNLAASLTNSTDASCSGASDGTAEITPTGQIGSVSYVLDGGTPQVDNGIFTGLADGTHQVILTDDNNCTVTVDFVINTPSPMSITLTPTDISCSGISDGSISSTVSGGDGTYSYNWSNGFMTSDLSSLSVGDYTVTITDGNNCSITDMVTISELSPILILLDSIPINCFGETNGSAIASVSGGAGNYTYAWNDFQITNPAINLASGTYTVTVSDASGCTATESIEVTQPSAALQITSLTQTQTSCANENLGEATVIATGGTGIYSYAWSSTGLTDVESNLSLGTYTVTITDENGCTASQSIDIIEYPLLESSISGTNTSCNGGNDGTATAVGIGGSNSYTFLWSDPNAQTTATATNLLAGTYTVTLTDTNNCSTTNSILLTESSTLGQTETILNLSCFGDTNGLIISYHTGGTAPYQYNWSTGYNDSSVDSTFIDNLAAGGYTITITDDNGCSITREFTITEPSTIDLTLTGTDANCFGGSDGSANVLANGGTPPYTYLWSDPMAQTMDNITGLTANTYTVTVTDGNLCSAEESIIINEPNTAVQIVSLIQTDTACLGEDLGIAMVVAAGGTGTHTYVWSSGGTSDVETNLSPGTYTVTISDANACSIFQSVDIFEHTAIIPSISGTDLSCNASGNGTATANAIGGSGIYTYLWDDANAQTTQTAVGLDAGSYIVTITDSNNCSTSTTITLTEPTIITQTEVIADVLCFGEADGSIISYQAGGTAPYQYNWSTGYTGPSADSTHITNLIAGNYTVTITDDNACTITREFTINEPSMIDLTLSGTDVNCFGGNDGSANVIATGGTPPYTYLWSDLLAQTTDNITGLTVNTYTVTVTDDNLCSVEESIIINEPNTGVQIVSVLQTDTACIGENLGIAMVVATGGTGTYTYAWSSGGTSDIETNLSPGTYTVTISDANACSISQSVNIFEHTAVIPSISRTDLSCNASGDGTATASATGGSGVYTYLWSDSNAQTTPTAVGLNAGPYIVTITDSNNCSASTTITLLEPTAITQTETITNVLCFGEANGSIISYQTGGTAPYQYNWSTGYTGPSADNTEITNLIAGTYTVTITDDNACTITREFTITEPDILNLSFSGANVNCLGGNDGEITTTATGGITPYTYLWDDPAAQTTATASGLSAGMYTVIITDSNSCTISDSYTITEPATAIQITSISQTFIGCNGSNLGEAEVSVTGGTGAYTYNWSSGGTTSSVDNLAPMTHTVTITDANDCSLTGTVDIVEYALMTATATATDVSCLGGNNGTASVTLISGGAGTGNLSEYTYAWSGTSLTSANATGLSVGTHTVTITDIEGCITTVSVDITSPTELTSSVQTSVTGCSDSSNGVAIVTGFGGTPPYTYEWDSGAGGSTLDTLSGLAPGGYNVTVTDANNCSTFSLAYIPQIEAISIEFESTDLSCSGSNDGSATATVTGGVSPFTYTWSTGFTSTEGYASSLWAGYHTVTVMDANGCEGIASVSIASPSELTLDVDIIDITCNGDQDGSILITGSGGTYPYTYSFNNEAFGSTNYMGGIFAGYYNVAVQDYNGCIIQVDSVLVAEPLPLEAIIDPSDDIIELALGDSLLLSGGFINGTGDISFLWDALYNDSTLSCDSCQFPIVNSYENDRYTLTVTDENGCMDTEDIEINITRNREIFVPGGFTPNGDNVNDVLMVHGKTGTVVQTFRVYDRWGELVFRADGYDVNSTESFHTWNGEMKGKPMNPGIFIWYLEVIHIDGREESFEGNTSLLR